MGRFLGLRAGVILGAGLVVAGCASAPTIGPQIAIDPQSETAVQAQVANRMKDPSSAEFRNMRAFRTSDGVMICGEVNAKNSFGGYVGFSDFLVFGKGRGEPYAWGPPAVVPAGDAIVSTLWERSYPGCF